MRKTHIELKKTKNPQLNKALVNIEDTLNGINDKLEELRELDKGSKFFAVLGWLLIGLGGGGLLTMATAYRNINELLWYVVLFFMSSLLVIIMLTGYMLSHKGLTGDWL